MEGLFITTAGQKTVNQGHIASILISLPPLAEQQRIVAKVDELISLCDELESRLTTTATTRRQLLESNLHEALEGRMDHQQECQHAG
jgi:type I restriction enzyme S subunit